MNHRSLAPWACFWGVATLLVGAGCARRVRPEARSRSSPDARADFAPGATGAPEARADARSIDSLVACVIELARQQRQQALAPNQAASVCGGFVTTTELVTSWQVRTPFPQLNVIVNGASALDRPSSEISMSIRLEAEVKLADVAAVLGAYSTIFESKTSSVSFRGAERSGDVFVDLLSSKVHANAPVTRILARAPEPPAR